jgi:hypothetical protein
MNLKNVLFRRLRTPRALALAGLMALVIVVTALALTQTSTVAAPPPPLRGPFRFIEMPKEMNAAVASTSVLSWTPFYTQTFGASFYSDSHWEITNTTALYNPPAPYLWGIVQQNEITTQPFTDTLWVKADAKSGIVYERYKLPSGAIYTKTMDTWAIYGPLDSHQYGRFRAEFDFYLDTDPGASFGWAVSADGTNFYGPATLSGHTGWTHSTVMLPSAPGQTNPPVYLAFFFQSDDSEPAGLGALVDNLVISGEVWNKTYLPVVRRENTPTPAASPTATGLPYTIDHAYDFEPGTASTGDWCQTSNSDWAAGLKSLGGSNAYYFKIKPTTYKWALSPRGPSSDNYTLVGQFNLLGMDSGKSLANYAAATFGVVFSVYGDPFSDSSHCGWRGDSSNGGYYKFYIKINGSGTGFKTRLARSESSGSGLVEPEEAHADFKDLPSGVSISRTSWNTLQIDRNYSNNTIYVYINGTLVESWSPSDSHGGGYFGLFAETNGTNPNGDFEADWDNIIDYKR